MCLILEMKEGSRYLEQKKGGGGNGGAILGSAAVMDGWTFVIEEGKT